MPSKDEPFDPSTLHVDAFLAGPDRYEDHDGEGDLLDIDDIFGKDFSEMMADQREDHLTHRGASVDFDPGDPRTPSQIVPGYEFVEIEAGLLLLDPEGNPVGGYIGCDVAVEYEHRGKGLGSELILEYAMRNGSLPTWHLDEPAYSSDGERAHRTAHAMARDRTLFAAKREAILAMSSPAPAP